MAFKSFKSSLFSGVTLINIFQLIISHMPEKFSRSELPIKLSLFIFAPSLSVKLSIGVAYFPSSGKAFDPLNFSLVEINQLGGYVS